jgi:hypothetical protein
VNGDPLDLSEADGFSFSAKGTGILRFNVGTAAMLAAEDWDLHGMDVPLTNRWRRYVVRFDDPRFGQSWTTSAPFTPSEVAQLEFKVQWEGPFDFSVDNLEILSSAE